MCVACGILVSQPGGELGYPAGEARDTNAGQTGNSLPHSFLCILFSLSVLALALMVNSILQHGGWPLVDLYLGISQLLPLEDFFTAALVN